MKKRIITILIVLVVISGTIVYLATWREKPCSSCEKNAKGNKTTAVKFADYFKDETDMCNILTKETVSNLLGKTVVNTNSVTANMVHSCQYYISDNQAVIVNYDTLNVEKQKTGQEFLDRKIITNSKILMKHMVVVQENGLINRIYLVLGDNEYVAIDRTSGKTISEDEMISFAARLAEIVSGIVPLSVESVPLPQLDDSMRNFFALIDEKSPSEAVSMLSAEITRDESLKQAWAVQFNAINHMKVVKIEPARTEDWSADMQMYKLTLEVEVNPEAANAVIPYYGWNNGENIRWVTIVREKGLWKIQGLATGP